MNKTLLAAALAVATSFAAPLSQAADIVPINNDPAGQGLNDPTPISPQGGNSGTTVGEQRRIVYQFAADLWGAVLQSDVQIRVGASFRPLRCDSTGTVLGSAGAAAIYVLTSNNDPSTAMLYHGALADALIGEDLQAGAGLDINTNFNSAYGNTNPDGSPCSPGAGWYYGLDGKTPEGKTDFLNVVMHEIAHGLGFSGFGSVSTGAPLAGYRDIYSSYVFDNRTNLAFYQLPTNAARREAITGGNLAWTGPMVTAQVPNLRSLKTVLRVSGTLSAAYDFGTAAFGPEAAASNFDGDVVAVNDGSASPSLGCAASPAGAYLGKVALVSRGGCSFEIKAKHAQDAGASAVVIANNVSGTINMAADDTVEATVPTIMVSLADGQALRAAIPGVRVAIGTVPGVLAGADRRGRALLFSPNPVQPGSSFSHFDTSSSPNALMEPAITRTLMSNLDLDLTPSLFADEGWQLNPGNATIGADCNTGIPAVSADGVIVGANIQAWDRVCAATATHRGEYVSCMVQHRNLLRESGLITNQDALRLARCAASRKGL